jgi:glycosyltransferase involved in cell wall biosynthesis
LPNTKILIVSYLFPPAGGIAVQRVLSLAKYLPQHGFDVHILTAANAAAPVRDPGLLKHVPPSVTVHKAFTPEIPFAVRQAIWARMSRGSNGAATKATANGGSGGWKKALTRLTRRVLCPEPEVLWVPFALRKARQVVRQHGIEAVLVSVPPFSAFLVGNALKREFPDLKYVADFRDEWLSFYVKDFEYQSGEYTQRRAAEIERETVERADLVVAVTESTRETIRKRYAEQPDGKFACIPNGYDPDVFANFTPRPSDPNKLIVTHVGTVYKTASPAFYLDALDAMPEEFRSKVETRFIGRIAESERAVLENRKSAVRILGFMPQAEALRWMEETDCLLLTMTNEISLPGKLFEYLATGKFIVALSSTHGEVFRLLNATGAGECLDPDNAPALQDALKHALESKCRRKMLGHRRLAITSYSRVRLAEQYGALIKTSAAHSSGSPGNQ